MEIGIYTDLVNNERAGVGTYVYHLVNNLLKIGDGNKYHLVDYRKSGIFSGADELIIGNPFRGISKTYAWYLYSAIRLNKNKDIDIVHNPSQVPTYFKARQKSVVTAHDITPMLLPDAFLSGRPMIYRALFLKTLKNADRIIAVSDSTRRDILRYVNIPPEKICTIYEGVDQERYKPLSRKEVQVVDEKYAINFPYILYTGTLEPRKNIPFLIEAFHIVRRAGIKHKLVIVGKRGWKYKEVFKTVDRLELQNDVVFTGYIPVEDLPVFYNAADIFVYPSLYEGFGLPPLEAMACGTPVITSNTSSFPEVVGDAGIMVDPHDVNQLAEEMQKILTNTGLRQDMIGKGLERVKLFSWEKMAIETLKVYEKVSI